MRKILLVLVLMGVFAIPGFAEAGNKHLLKKMTKPSCKEKMASCKEKMANLMHPCNKCK